MMETGSCLDSKGHGFEPEQLHGCSPRLKRQWDDLKKGIGFQSVRITQKFPSTGSYRPVSPVYLSVLAMELVGRFLWS